MNVNDRSRAIASWLVFIYTIASYIYTLLHFGKQKVYKTFNVIASKQIKLLLNCEWIWEKLPSTHTTK